MLYYFSGTGNSEYVAKTLAQLTDDTAVDLAALMKAGNAAVSVGPREKIGLVFPIYAWGAPKIVEEFADRLVVAPTAYAYAVCTCGSEAGLAMRRLKRRFPWKAAWSLSMPNNYILMGSDVDSPEVQRAKLDAAGKKLPVIAEAVRAQAAVEDVARGSGAFFKSTLICPFFRRFAASTKPFFADENCDGCGLCAQNCPASAIRMEAGHPVWVEPRCLQCAACINRCPKRAIQYGEGTKNCGRYRFPGAD